MSIILVRHGETPLNVARTLQPADTPLSATGLAQAEAVAKRLAGLQLAAIVSSDLPRALSTAQAIAAATGAPISTTTLLHERNFGDLRGQPYDTLGFNPLTMN
jgi:probable phosphoglycerate mutase